MCDELQAWFGLVAGRRVGAVAESMSQLGLSVVDLSPDTIGGAQGEQALAQLPRLVDTTGAL